MFGDYPLSEMLERLYENQQAPQAPILELTLLVEEQGAQEVGGNVRGALWTMNENMGHIKRGARLRRLDIGQWITHQKLNGGHSQANSSNVLNNHDYQESYRTFQIPKH